MMTQGPGPIMGGNLLGAAVGLGSLPIIARLYMPGTYGRFAVLLAIITILNGVSTLRLDQKIPYAPREERRALRLASGYVLAAITALIGISFAIFWHFGGGQLGLLESALATAAVFLIGNHNREIYLAVARAAYQPVGVVYGLVPTVQVLVQVGLGFVWPTLTTLLLGVCVSKALGWIVLRWRIRVPYDETPEGVTPAKNLALVGRTLKGQFKWWAPITVGSLANTGATQMVLPLITFAFGAPAAGVTALWLRVLSGPTTVVGVAVGQWFSRELRDKSTTAARKLYGAVARKMVLLAAVVMVTAVPLISLLQEAVLPGQWNISILPLIGIAMFASAQLAVAFGIHMFGFTNRTSLQFRWELGRLVATFVALGVVPLLVGYSGAMLTYGFVSVASYAVQAYLIRRVQGVPE